MLADILHQVAGQFEGEEHKYYPRPSLAGPDRCIRQMVYWGLGFEEKPLPGRTLFIFNDGHWHEELTFDWIRKSAFELHSEQMEVECRQPMKRGHIDGIVTDLVLNDYLIEHKGLNHFTFEKYWKGELPNDYLAQTCIYFDGLLKVASNIKGALLLIKNKNTSAYIEFLIIHNGKDYEIVNRVNSQGETKPMNIVLDGVVERAAEKFVSVDEYIEMRKIPKRQYDIDDWHCGYCGYRDECWGDYQKEFYELKTDAMLPNEVADMVRYYKELGAQKGNISTEYDELRDKIKRLMKENNVREGHAGEYICRLKLQKDNKERLYISSLKERGNGDE